MQNSPDQNHFEQLLPRDLTVLSALAFFFFEKKRKKENEPWKLLAC